MERRLVLLAALVFVVLVAWWLWPSAAVTNYPSSGSDIVAFGDSLVTGIGGKPGGFVSLVAKNLSVSIANLGKPGDTSADGLARLHELNQYQPKVVILLFGGNDYLKRVPPDDTFANLAYIIEDIQRRGSSVLLLGVRGGLLQDNFAARFEALAKRYRTAYVPDVLDGLIGNRAYTADQVHPNDAGYAQIATRVGRALEPLLK